MKNFLKTQWCVLFLVVFICNPKTSFSQYCDSITPTLNVNLSASPNVNWISPPIVRDGNCCGTTNPDRCLEFIITLHPNAIAVNFAIASGAVPPGALFYQIDCGPITPVGSPICLDGPGPHHLTFCKPGNNENTFSITSYSEPVIGADTTLNAGCQGLIYAQYYNEPSMTWTSIAPGNQGDYDSYLSCTAGCDTTYVTAPNSGAPAFVDYLVCGFDIGMCNPAPICDTIRVSFVPPVDVQVTPAISTICAGDPPVLLTANVTGGTGPFTYLWSNGATTPTILETGGVHSVTVTDQGGCLDATASATVTENPLPPVDAGPDQSVCDGVSIALSGSGAVSYTWDNGVIDGISFTQAVGTITYTVTGTDANGCVNTDQVNVTVNPLPIVDAGADQSVCDGANVVLNGSGAVSYAWDNGVVDGVSFVPPLGTTTYTVTGTDGNSCSSSDQVSVLVNPLPPVSAGSDITVCEGTSISLIGSGAISYVWDNGVVDGVSFVPPLGSTTYTVFGTDVNGCSNSDQVIVNVNPLPVVDAGSDQSVCDGVSVTLNGSGASSYSWDNGVTDGVSFVQTVGTITYTVTGTDANGCVNTDQVDVTVNPLPLVDAGSDQTVCDGMNVVLNGSGALSYAWDNGVIDGVSFLPSLGTTIYTVIGTDGNGCSNSDQVNVVVNPLPMVNAGADITVCEGTSVSLSGSGAISYVWDNGVVDGVSFIPPLGSTTYSVIGTDANGCSNGDQVIVNVNPLPIVDAGIDQFVCDGTSVILNGSGAVSYSWNNGITDGVGFVQAVGTSTYTVTGTDANGCVNIDQVDVTVHALPLVDAGVDQQVCIGASIVLNGSGATSFAWDNGVVDGVSFVPNLGLTVYTVIGTDANGCSNSDHVQVQVNPLPAVDAGPDQVVCEGTSVTLNGSGALTYIWDNGVIDGVGFVQNVGVQSYTVTGTDGNGCANTDQVEVTVNALPTVDAGPDQAVCEGETVVLNGSGTITYSWNNGVTNGVGFIQSVGTVNYEVTGTDANGCSNLDQTNVTVHPLPVIDAGLDQSVCEGTPVILTADGSPNLSWNNGVLNNVPFIQPIGTVTYTVFDTLQTGCSASDDVQVTVHPNPVVSAEDQEICAGEGVTLTAQGAQSYVWSAGVIDGVEFFPLQTAEYVVTGTNSFGCSASDTARVTVFSLPIADFSIHELSLSTVASGTGFDNLSVGAVDYEWDFGDGSGISNDFEPYHEFPDNDAGSYEIVLTATSEEGCVAEKVKYVYVTLDYTIYVPNAFTPDANGVNEVFKPVMDGFDENDYTLYIFNRWGELVFESHDMEVGWDGTYSQLDAGVQDGVFTWKIEVGIKNSSDSKIFVGHVSILK